MAIVIADGIAKHFGNPKCCLMLRWRRLSPSMVMLIVTGPAVAMKATAHCAAARAIVSFRLATILKIDCPP
ncbi:hypothetical protein [Rhizobium sp. Root483D2]|uniref:hypothetical protein n=1 Tax=Rhizobium sp. Root483D2 TaxID=1736545 RepID=UPI0012E3DC32|nr:hypothetical protein [Rhizobium sp. Root483D2]